MLTAKLQTLEALLRELGQVAVAVSGGVDSMTLAVVAQRTLGAASAMFHAVSPAVPAEATERVRRYAAREGWRLRLLDAGEFADPAYRNNPVNRCFYCKTNLYQAIARQTEAAVVSGTNLDDLQDYRPGLQAAGEHGVRHPLVEAGIDKAMVRAVAHYLGLADLAELPASPCLSSRIETGLPIQPDILTLIHRVERYLTQQLQPRTVRCRFRRSGIVIELDRESFTGLTAGNKRRLVAAVETLCRQSGCELPLGFELYRPGSAFLHGSADA